MPKKPNYTLKAGAVVHPHGTSNFYTLNNIPDDVAEEWLGKFPGELDKFETYPADWESRVKARLEGKAVEPTIDELKAEVERLTATIEQKDVEIEGLKTNAGGDTTALNSEIEALKAELIAANEAVEKGKVESQAEVGRLNKTIDELKAEVERLTAALEKTLKAKSAKAKDASAPENTQEEGK